MEFLIDYNQFKPCRLWEDIPEITGCRKQHIPDIADGLCNVISTWALSKECNYHELEFKEFYKKLIDTGYASENGWIKQHKEVIFKEFFKVDFVPKFFEDFEDIINPAARLDKDCLYQLKIRNSDHYIACDIQNNIFTLYDTGKRGIGVPAIGAKRIDQVHFKWLLEYRRL